MHTVMSFAGPIAERRRNADAYRTQSPLTTDQTERFPEAPANGMPAVPRSPFAEGVTGTWELPAPKHSKAAKSVAA
jgi:hypothetical protein